MKKLNHLGNQQLSKEASKLKEIFKCNHDIEKGVV